ncbi:MAG: cation diffusion facilitator family transporter [Polyangiaceae bacterium]|nr:cation diffusion facilitator family transporter [Polyangiaceae bacterium]
MNSEYSSTEQAQRPGLDQAVVLSRLSAAVSLAICVLLGAAHFLWASELAFAQAVDSAVDALAGLVLYWSVMVSAQPRSRDFPLGKSRVEPLGALFIAVMAVLLGVEVVTSSIRALTLPAVMVFEPVLLFLFLAKLSFRGWIWSQARRGDSPALRALTVDARNDFYFGLVGVVGLGGIYLGYHSLDAWLALPLGLWVIWSGVELVKDNFSLLVGRAPPDDVCENFQEAALRVEGVLDVSRLVAQYLGPEIDVQVSITVDGQLDLQSAHDIGELVQGELLALPQVGHVSVHIDPAES